MKPSLNTTLCVPCGSTPLMQDLFPLAILARGDTAIVGQLAGQPDHVHRLQEMGFRDGASIEMIQPGNPCVVRLSGQKLCFRTDELLRVMVHQELPT